MKKEIRKWTASWLTIAFAWTAFGLIYPRSLKAGAANGDSSVSTVEAAKNSDPEIGSHEKEGNTPEIAKKKKLPWLWVAAGTVVVGVIIYFTLIKKEKSDIRGQWRFWIEKEKHNLDISFSGEIASGTVVLLDDPDSYWWDRFGMTGRIGDYKVSSSKISIEVTKIEYPIGSFALSGNFTSTDAMSGTYIYYYGDPAFKSEGTWTAFRIK